MKRLVLKRLLILFTLSLVLLACKEEGLNLKISYDQIQGLKKGDRVIFDQNHVGRVTDLFYEEDGYYTVQVVIKKDFANAATVYSRFIIITDPQDFNRKAVEITRPRKGGSLLEDGATVDGSARGSVFFDQIWDKFGKNLEELKEQLKQFSDELQKIPESEEFKKLEKEWKRLSEEMKQTGKAAREKLEKEILPGLKQELEKLREKLRELREKQKREKGHVYPDDR